MTQTTIRQFASSHRGTILAAAEFEKIVHLYDLNTMEHLTTLNTTLDFGGKRLAISDDGQTVFVGAYHVHGIAAYSIAGPELWRRKDLKKVQHITLTTDNTRVLCCFEQGSCESLNALTGKSGRALRGVKNVWESPLAPVRFLERSRDYATADFEAPIARIDRVSFSVLAAAFSPASVCISEAAGPVRAFDTHSGVELWRYDPPEGAHFLELAYVEVLDTFAGVSWPSNKGGPLLLQRLTPSTGTAQTIGDIGTAHTVIFCQRGAQLVTNTGAVFDVKSGRQIASLPFPLKPGVPA